MKIRQGGVQYELPRDLHDKLQAFRRKLWSNKVAEGAFVSAVLLCSSFLLSFGWDRWTESPSAGRMLLLLAGLAGWLVYLPWQVYRWVWQHRELTQLARLMAQDQPRVGDRLLGVIELVEKQGDAHASPGLCRAAIQQVADDTRSLDFMRSLPRPRHRAWGWGAAVAGILALGALCVPGAGWNALQRWARPWAQITRFTYTRLADVPDQQVIPIGEPATLTFTLEDNSAWKPQKATVRYGRQPAIRAELVDGAYQFELPAQTEPGKLTIKVGDARHTVAVEPKTRPELKTLLAHVELPNYLGYEDLQRDARSGIISLVKGSQAKFSATTSRELAKATINGTPEGVGLKGATIESPEVAIEDQSSQEFQWVDVDGLSAKSPFRLRIRSVSDYAPTVQCSDLPVEKVVLDEETLSFEVVGRDDFGVQRMGIEWEGIADPRRNPQPQKGEYLIAAGKQDATALTAQGAFSPKELGIEPQPIQLKVFAEDYYPGRGRSYSQVYRLFVLNRQQHMIWITEQLERWERQALEVRDEEERLLKVNEELKSLSPEDLDKEANRKKIAQQAAAERANARRLSGLTDSGENLVAEAARNPEFNVATLEKWAQVLKALKAISGRSMPSVATQLSNAANATPGSPKPAAAPSVSDPLRAANRDPDLPGKKPDGGPNPPGKPSGALKLPSSTLAGPPGKNSGGGGGGDSAADSVEEAVEEQQELLEEFNRVMDDLAQVLKDLQGSTFVKRLKAAADFELKMASELHEELPTKFGATDIKVNPEYEQMVTRLSVGQLDTSTDVRLIQEDLLAYFERTQQPKFQAVHDEMKEAEVVTNFQDMSNSLQRNMSGETIGLAEFWADQLDRWAEMLVGPGCPNSGKCPGGKGDSLPPSIVLEVMRILKAEVDLRDNTRVAEQTRSARQPIEHVRATSALKETQSSLVDRTDLVIETLERMQTEQGKNYKEALGQLTKAVGAMVDASDLLSSGESGGPTIAAETEAIESLLLTKRIKPGSGGGSGSTPGGGTGTGAADEASALAGLGDELMTEERGVSQATGATKASIPEEFRAGLDAYFSGLEGKSGG